MGKRLHTVVVGMALVVLVGAGCAGDHQDGGPRIVSASANNPETGDATLWLGGPMTATTDYKVEIANETDGEYPDVDLEVSLDQGGVTEVEHQVAACSFGAVPARAGCEIVGGVLALERGVTFAPGDAWLRFTLVQGTGAVLDEVSIPVLLEVY